MNFEQLGRSDTYSIGTILALAAIGAATQCLAQYPVKPIQMTVSSAPGAGTDLVGRTVADKLAERLGYRIKLLGITKRRPEGIELRVHPALVPVKSLLANVEGAMNAVLVRGDAVGQTLYYGKGAGEEPTASAVVADLVDVTRLHTADPEHRVPHLAFQPDAMADTPILAIDDIVTSYYLRLTVADQPGVLADLARVLADAKISIGSMIQQPAEQSADAELIFLTHEAIERNVNAAIVKIEALPFVRSRVTRLRMESLA